MEAVPTAAMWRERNARATHGVRWRARGSGHRLRHGFGRVISLACLILDVFGGHSAHGQAAVSGKLEFDVASLKAVSGSRARRASLPSWLLPGSGVEGAGVEGVGGRVTMHSKTLADLTSSAYKLKVELVSGPVWITEDLYDVDARLPAGATYAQAPEMLQVLLEKRFGLVSHKDQRSLGGYKLVVGRGGPHLKAWVSKPPDPNEANLTPAERAAAGVARLNAGGGGMPVWVGHGSTKKLADFLWHSLACPVVDLTGISGDYAFEFRSNSDPSSEPNQWIFDSLGKLGLELRSDKVRVETFVVDYAKRVPEPN